MITASLILVCFLGITIMAIIWFSSSFSETKADFERVAELLTEQAEGEDGVFEEEDIADLPLPVQKYLRHCGYIGKRKMSYMRAVYNEAVVKVSPERRTLLGDYIQINTVQEPNRVAYVTSSLYGMIPVEGLDIYMDGKGSMRQVIAKLFNLFNETGSEVEKNGLISCLAECLIVPSAALQDYITWEEMDELHAKATISHKGVSVSGVFAFDEDGKLLSFTTFDRMAIDANADMKQIKSSATWGDYVEKDGLIQPTSFRVVCHYDEGDMVSFHGKGAKIEYDE